MSTIATKAPTTTEAAIDPAMPIDADQRVSLFGIGWEGFEVMARLLEDRPRPQVVYLDGRPAPDDHASIHERLTERLGMFVRVVVEELDIACEPTRETTFRRHDIEVAVQPDDSFYLANHAVVAALDGKIKVDLDVDPPPDLVDRGRPRPPRHRGRGGPPPARRARGLGRRRQGPQDLRPRARRPLRRRGEQPGLPVPDRFRDPQVGRPNRLPLGDPLDPGSSALGPGGSPPPASAAGRVSGRSNFDDKARRTAMATIRIPYPGDPDERRALFERAAILLAKHGSYDGTPDSGAFRGTSPIGVLAGHYWSRAGLRRPGDRGDREALGRADGPDRERSPPGHGHRLIRPSRRRGGAVPCPR